jgi:hypothetical protein
VAKVSAVDIAAEKITVRLHGNHQANAHGWVSGILAGGTMLKCKKKGMW